jgi:adenylate kinase family enzyme
MKNDDETIRLNCDSRIMVDPVTFRRVNPNYLHSHPHWGHKDYDYEIGSSADIAKRDGAKNKEPRTYAPPELIGEHAENQCPGLKKSRRPCRAAGNADCGVARVSANKGTHFTEEELLIASPVVLGFELTEKCWLEFSLAGLHEIQWNADAMRSVIMPDCTKRNLDALISNHSSDAVSRPANVVGLEEQGLNVVLHGPSGVGKTMTGVAIAEHLRRPLYTMNTDELGISASSVAQSLGEIVENVRSWGAVLLLDAADIYLESRQAHDIHHNSVVSVLLRFLERHNSILIMTTDRLESFDRAIQSHIHMGIRFENPSAQMRKTMWRQQVLEAQQGVSTRPRDKESVKSLSEEDFDHLSKRALDGRQVS